MKYTTTLLLLLGALLQAACTTQAVYTGESFGSDSPFRMRADGDVAMACESARRALLGQGYLIESASAESVKARKAYRTEDTQNTFIEMNIVCLSDASGSTLYTTGVLTTYALKKSTSSASVGLSALGSISLPIGQSADSLVKVSEETIDDKDFYKRYFSAVDIILGEMRASTESTVPVPAESGPATASTAPSAPPEHVPLPTPGATKAESIPVPPAYEMAPAPVATSTDSVSALPASDKAPEPVATQQSAPAPSPAKAAIVPAAASEPVPAPANPDPAAAQKTSTTVLEEFAAPRSEPYR